MFTTEPLPSDLDYPEAKKFMADYKAKYGEDAGQRLVGHGRRCLPRHRAGDQATKSTDPKKLAEYLHKDFKNFPGITGPILGFDEKGDRIGTIHKAYVINDKGEIRARAEAAVTCEWVSG